MKLSKLIEKVTQLPTLPEVVQQINGAIAQDSLTAKSLAAIIEKDASLTAMVLKLSNSAFYGMTRNVCTLDKAVMVLGFNTVKNLALSVSVFKIFEEAEKSGNIDVQGLWKHGLGTGVAAKTIISKSSRKLGEDAFLFGVIHDIGKIILIKYMPEEFEQVLVLMRSKNMPQSDAEVEVLGMSHQSIGAMLLDTWKFPESMIAAVKYHHDLELKKRLDPELENLIKALFVGNQFAKAINLGESINPTRTEIPSKFWKELGIERDKIQELREEIEENFEELLASWNLE